VSTALYLTLRYLRARPWPALLLVFALALTASVPWLTHRLVTDLEASLKVRAQATPLLVGARGSRFDLTLAALYFRPSSLDTFALKVAEELSREAGLLAVPMHSAFTARGAPLVGVGREYFERRGLRPAQGRLPNWVGECVLGARLARRLDLGPGDELVSDTLDLVDLAKPPAIHFRLVGVLAPTRGPDDEVVFTDLNGAFAVAGLSHSHAEPSRAVESGQALGQTPEGVVLSGAFVPDQRIDSENRALYHLHADAGELPLTAILLFPADEKQRTLVEARLNARADLQAIRPELVVDELLATVLRLRQTLDSVALLLGLVTAGLAVSIGQLGAELRAAESHTLRRLGAGQRIAWRLHGTYWGLILLTGFALAWLLVQLALWWVRDPTRFL
jgi:putative ABC transport system permease protein